MSRKIQKSLDGHFALLGFKSSDHQHPPPFFKWIGNGFCFFKMLISLIG